MRNRCSAKRYCAFSIDKVHCLFVGLIPSHFKVLTGKCFECALSDFMVYFSLGQLRRTRPHLPTLLRLRHNPRIELKGP